MQTCSNCNIQSPDTIIYCPGCHADLRNSSMTAVAYQKFKQNSRISSIRVSVSKDACPVCQQMQGNYSKDNLPQLPTPGCSHENGCRCYYDPVLNEIFP